MAQVGDLPEFVDAERVDQLINAAVAYATEHTVGQLRPWLARRVIRLCPEAAELRRQRAMADRRVVITPGSDGMSELWALLPSVQARQIQQMLSAVAHSAAADDPRTADQRRVDGMLEILLGEREAPPVAMTVVVAGDASAISAELAGVSAITAEQVAELLAQAGTVRTRVIPCDATTGYLVPSVAVEARYRPSGQLDQDVRARDVTCRFPGCRRAAQGSASGVDVDHTVPWPSGNTGPDNLACLCRRHHRLKHIGTWSLEQRGDGVLRWAGPTGRTYETTPWEYTDPVPT